MANELHYEMFISTKTVVRRDLITINFQKEEKLNLLEMVEEDRFRLAIRHEQWNNNIFIVRIGI